MRKYFPGKDFGDDIFPLGLSGEELRQWREELAALQAQHSYFGFQACAGTEPFLHDVGVEPYSAPTRVERIVQELQAQWEADDASLPTPLPQ